MVLLKGAQEVITTIQQRRSVTKLVLGHNDLRDDGCVTLFRYLCSTRGRKHCISEISLNSNAIGDLGLSAIADYLQGNEHLTDLFLQNVSRLVHLSCREFVLIHNYRMRSRSVYCRKIYRIAYFFSKTVLTMSLH